MNFRLPFPPGRSFFATATLSGLALGLLASCAGPRSSEKTPSSPSNAAAAAAPGDEPSSDESAPLSEAIRENRMGTLVIRTKPGARVTVRQLRHEFWFGAALASQAFDGGMPSTDAVHYKQVFLENFNAGVTENAFKWLSMEPRRGEVNYTTVDAILRWTDAHQIPLRGHNVFWGIEKFVQPWLKTMSDDELRSALEARAREVARRYRGRFTEYDLNNEMVHGNYYADRLGPKITRDMADWIRGEDPGARIFVNDYDILTGNRLSEYVAQIHELQAMGVPVAGIGVQGHLHGDTFDRAALKHSLDELAKLRLPIRVTEFNLPGQRSHVYLHPEIPLSPAEEQAKARDLVDYYRICFEHPAVDGILMWGFWAGANWIPQSSLYRRDWTPTPAARAYHDLVYKEWWTHWSGRADAEGRCEVPAFFGLHRVMADGRAQTVSLKKSEGSATVDLR